VLAIEPGKGKAHYRRGLAYEGLGQYSAALDDLRQVSFIYLFIYLFIHSFIYSFIYSYFPDLNPQVMVTLPTLVVDEAFDRVETLYQMTPGMPSRENWKEEEEGKEEGKEKEGPFPPFPKERARIVDRAFRNVFSRAVGLTNALSYFVHDKPPPSPPSSPPSSPPPSPPPSPPRPSSSSSSSPPPLPPPPLPTHLVVRPDIKPAAVAAANAGNIDLAQELLLLNPSEGGELQQ